MLTGWTEGPGKHSTGAEGEGPPPQHIPNAEMRHRGACGRSVTGGTGSELMTPQLRNWRVCHHEGSHRHVLVSLAMGPSLPHVPGNVTLTPACAHRRWASR